MTSEKVAVAVNFSATGHELTFRDAAGRINDSKDDDEEASAAPVGHPADEAAEDHGGAKAGHEELGDLVLFEAVIRVQRVDVGPLQPIAERRHEVDEEVPLQQARVGLPDLVGQAIVRGDAAPTFDEFLVVVARPEGDGAAQGEGEPEQQRKVFHLNSGRGRIYVESR
jgi:hypothetical protein